MPVTQKYPTTRPALLLNFARSRQLDPRITFTRASTGTIVNSSGLIEIVADNRPRFTFNPVTLASEGLLIEEQRTNFATYSEQFDNAAWTKRGGTGITANQIIAPDGTLTGDLMFDNAVSTGLYVRQQITAADNTIWAISAYVKKKDVDDARLIFYGKDVANSFLVNLKFSTETLTSSVSGTMANTSAGFSKENNGWYRIWLTGNAGTGANSTIIYNLLPARSVAPTGDGTTNLYIWGAQIENGPFITSYIPTMASQVTRQTDVATMTGTNFSSWYNAAGSTIITEGKFNATLGAGQFGAAWTIGSTGTNRYSHIYNPSAAAGAYVVTDNVVQMNTSGTYSGAFAENVRWKHAFALATNDCAEVVNAGTPATDNSVTLPTSTIFWIGANSGGIVGSQTISKIAYYNSRLSNAQLQELTR